MATRKIKNAKDLVTDELIYFKSHAQATFMSDGTTVEDKINGLQNGGGVDLSKYVQKTELSSVATSGNYNDLSNKPTIPSAVTESTVSGWGFTKNAGTVTGVKANGTAITLSSGVANIPAASTSAYGVTKLSSATNSTSTSLAATASAVKAAYDLANSYKGTVTGVKINGTTKNPSSGVVDLGTVITAHQTLKTINGQSIIGSGDITISGSSSSGSGAYPEVDGSIYKDEQFLGNYYIVDESMPLMPNTFYVFPECDVLDVSLGSETSGVANEYLFQFTSGSEPTTLILPYDIKWANGEAPVIEANKIYQISILKGLGSVLEFSNEVQSVPIVFYVNDTPYDAMSNMTWNDFIHSDYNTNIPNTSDKWFIDKNGYPAYALLHEGELDVYTELVRTSGGVPTLWDKIQDCLNYIAS